VLLIFVIENTQDVKFKLFLHRLQMAALAVHDRGRALRGRWCGSDSVLYVATDAAKNDAQTGRALPVAG